MANGRADNTQRRLGDNDEGVQLDAEDRNFRQVLKYDEGGYLRGVWGCGSSTTEKRERQRKEGLVFYNQVD